MVSISFFARTPSAPVEPPSHRDPLFLLNVPRLYISFFLFHPLLYCISLSPSFSLPTAMAPCCGAPSGCVWDDVVGWHLAASDKRASAGSIPSEILLIFFFLFGGV